MTCVHAVSVLSGGTKTETRKIEKWRSEIQENGLYTTLYNTEKKPFDIDFGGVWRSEVRQRKAYKSAVEQRVKATWIECISQIFTIITTICSIKFVLKANDKLSAASDDYNLIIANWEKVPIVDVEAVSFASGGGACSDGYKPMATVKWPGDRSAGCGCPSNSKYVSKSSRSCNSSEVSDGCRTDKDMAMETVPYGNWRGMSLCTKTSGEPTVIDFTAYGSGTGDGTENAKIRPIPDKNGIVRPIIRNAVMAVLSIMIMLSVYLMMTLPVRSLYSDLLMAMTGLLLRTVGLVGIQY